MNTKLGIEKDSQVFLCDRCAQEFSKEQMIEEDYFLWCKECFAIAEELFERYTRSQI